MTRVDIISGFLGAGKTTLIKKLLKEALQGEQVVLIENEFGEIGIDGGFLKEAGIEIREMNSGCICCSLVGDFTASLREVLVKYHPDRIIIEPSGVGKLSDVIVAVQKAMEGQDVIMNSSVSVVDVLKCKMYMKNFGEFFNNQIESAGTVILSRTGKCKAEKMNQAIELIRGLNAKATVITTDWTQLEGAQILATMEATGNLEADLLKEMMEEHAHHEHEHHHHHEDGEECCCGHHHHEHEEHEHHHHHYDENGVCECGHHHDEEEHEHHHHHHEDGEECHCHDHEHEHHHHEHEEHEHHHHHYDENGVCECGHHHDEEEHEHHHHHHEDGEECHCHDHEHEHEHHHHHYDENGVCECGHHHDEEEHEHHHHHHEDGEECCCGHHHDHDHHHHHHHADDVFTSCGFESPKAFTMDELEKILDALADEETYGLILRSKGMVPNANGENWIYFDMVPEEHEIREGRPEVTGKIVVIGSKINEDKLKALFGV